VTSPILDRDTVAAQPTPARVSLHGLDWLNFFLADIRTGVGPFVAMYLTTLHWSLARIGVALTMAEIAGVLTQAPGGAAIDRLKAKRLLLGIAVVVLGVSAVLMAKVPSVPIVYGAQLTLGVTGSVFGPGISAITLGLVGYKCLGVRTGRNAAFGSAGNVVAAVSMGILGYRYGTREIFYFVAVLAIPTLVSLLVIRASDIDYYRARGATLTEGTIAETGIRTLIADRRLLVFLIFTILYHLGNAAMLTMAGEMMAQSNARKSDLWMGALVTVPQLVMAAIGPMVGKIADLRGRKPILIFGFLFLPLRCLLFAFVRHPGALIPLQVLDGVSAGIFGIVGVLMIADCTEGTGHYNLALGTMGAAVGVGAAISTTMAGIITEHAGFTLGFLVLAVCGIAATLVLWLWMPETRVRAAGAVALVPEPSSGCNL
jgi:MFS family permease